METTSLGATWYLLNKLLDSSLGKAQKNSNGSRLLNTDDVGLEFGTQETNKYFYMDLDHYFPPPTALNALKL